MVPFCSTCRNLHVLCTHFAVMELSPHLGEVLLYFSVMPYGVIKMNRKGYTHKTHKLTNTCLPQVWRTADGEGLLRIERKMPSYPAGQMGSCWAAIWMLNSAHTQKPRHVCLINSQRPEEAKGKHQQWASVESICKTPGQAIILIRWESKEEDLYAEIIGEVLSSKVTARHSCAPNLDIATTLRPTKAVLKTSVQLWDWNKR